MTPKLILCLAFVLSGGLFGCSTVNEPPREYIFPPANAAELPTVVSYAKASPESLRQIKVARVSLSRAQLQKLNALPKSDSDGLCWLVEETPDTMRDGSWITRLYIIDPRDTNHCVRVELIEPKSVSYHWLNDRLLFVKVFLGRIAWTEFLLNVETRRFLYIEDGREEPRVSP